MLLTSLGPDPGHSLPFLCGLLIFLFTQFQALNKLQFNKLTLYQTEHDIRNRKMYKVHSLRVEGHPMEVHM